MLHLYVLLKTTDESNPCMTTQAIPPNPVSDDEHEHINTRQIESNKQETSIINHFQQDRTIRGNDVTNLPFHVNDVCLNNNKDSFSRNGERYHVVSIGDLLFR